MRLASSIAIILLASGCQLVFGFEDFEPAGASGAAGSGGGAAAGGSSGAAATGGGGSGGGGGGTEACDDPAAPAGMAGVRISNGACIWIDTHEVTGQEFDAFVQGLGSLAPYIEPPCQWKTSFAPGCGGDASSSDPTVPITCVDWCDARAYCISQGKTLCRGAPEPSWWQDACSENGANKYAYGSSYDPNACVGKENPSFGCPGPCTPTQPGGNAGCKTAGGVFDLNGNVAEWVDECLASVGATDQCTLRGGNFASGASELACDSTKSAMRDQRILSLGFRCCWQPAE